MIPQRSTRKRAVTVTRPRPGVGAVRPETLERLLADTSAGLSANAIAKQAGAGYSRTLKLLHELEAAGQVRRSGSRRSTVWQLITDEEGIAERAAELERLRSAPSRRRGRGQGLVASPATTSAVPHESRRLRRKLPHAPPGPGHRNVAIGIVSSATAGRAKHSSASRPTRACRWAIASVSENAVCASSLESEAIIGKRSRISEGLPSGACRPALVRLTPRGVAFCSRRGAAVWPAPAGSLLRLLRSGRLGLAVASATMRHWLPVG